MNRFYTKEFVPGAWRVYDRQDNDKPVWDTEGEALMIFHDEDQAEECARMLNDAEKFDKTRNNA